MAAGFPAKTSFTDGQALPASDLNDLSGTLNMVWNSSTPLQLSNNIGAVARPIPFATSTGRVTDGTNISANAGTAITVTFGSSTRFTQAPIVTVTSEAASASGTAYVATCLPYNQVTTSGFTFRVFNVGSVTVTGTYTHFHAIQMTSSSASNN